MYDVGIFIYISCNRLGNFLEYSTWQKLIGNWLIGKKLAYT